MEKTMNNEAAERLRRFILAHDDFPNGLAVELDKALATERSIGREEGRTQGRVDSNVGYREGYSAGAADARRATVERLGERFDAEAVSEDTDLLYRWQIQRILDEEAAR